jgi:hypothetical protein
VAEEDRTHCRGQQRQRRQERFLVAGDVPFAGDHRRDNADGEQVVGVGKESHARGEQDLPVLPTAARPNEVTGCGIVAAQSVIAAVDYPGERD